VLSEINGLTIDGFKSQKSEAGFLMRLDKVHDCAVSNTPGITSHKAAQVDHSLE
jgi:hypothetical protein